MSEKTKIAILFGGASSEYEISLRSVSFVLQNLDPDKYEVTTIGIDRQGDWFLFAGTLSEIRENRWRDSPSLRPAFFTPSPSTNGLLVLNENGTYEKIKIDVVFPVLHGWGGEDGRLQGLLDLAKIPYVGCGILASAACMDKEVAHVRLEKAGIAMTNWMWVSEGYAKIGLGEEGIYVTEEGQKTSREISKIIENRFGWPVFVKPCNAGSTVGISKIHGADELEMAFEKAFSEDRKILIEKAVVGQEVECAVLGNEDPLASVLGEIVAEDFYDYDAKYVNNTARLQIPAELSQETTKKVQEAALRAYKEMECTGLSRVDFFVQQDGTILLNEINTLPGFTEISMYPQLLSEMGYSGRELIDRLVGLALERE